jgi:hypothetical protein
MAKSKQRKGHNQKIATRNKIAKAQQKMFQEQMMKQLEELKKKFATESGTTENTDTNEMGLI